MKTFSKPAIGVISLLCVIIALLAYLLYRKGPNTNSTGLHYSAQMSELDVTKDITYEDAIRCKKKYNELKKGFILTTGKDPDKDLKDLEGWRLDLEIIRPILDEKDVKELFLVPIMQPVKSQDRSITPSETIVSLLIAGIIPSEITGPNAGKGNILADPSNEKKLFFEYLKPCPDNCPDNYYKIFK